MLKKKIQLWFCPQRQAERREKDFTVWPDDHDDIAVEITEETNGKNQFEFCLSLSLRFSIGILF